MRCVCGYLLDDHEPVSSRCPLAKTGRFRRPPPDDPALWPEIIRRDVAARFAKIEADRAAYVPPVVVPPQVPARHPAGPGEFASYQGKQAAGLGRAASQRGWAVAAYYWRAGDGTEGCAVKLRREDLRAVATWKRKPGSIGKLSGWEADNAYGWRLGTLPVVISHTMLLEMITSDFSQASHGTGDQPGNQG